MGMGDFGNWLDTYTLPWIQFLAPPTWPRPLLSPISAGGRLAPLRLGFIVRVRSDRFCFFCFFLIINYSFLVRRHMQIKRNNCHSIFFPHSLVSFFFVVVFFRSLANSFRVHLLSLSSSPLFNEKKKNRKTLQQQQQQRQQRFPGTFKVVLFFLCERGGGGR